LTSQIKEPLPDWHPMPALMSETKTKILSFYDYHFMTKYVSLRQNNWK